ncbi:MAG: hypothetical protein CL764_05245 [Chloroflexi bacterium]|nr:hypothetical protein [Chloroflexota bacterium]|tara:strand:- start:4216 stop:4878 length:663 start_codon:yes stop_codon:yes gene_type:complete
MIFKKILPVFTIILFFNSISCDNNQEIQEIEKTSIDYTYIDNSDSIKKLSESINNSPSDPELYFERGNLFLKSNQLINARKDFDKTIDLMPEATLAYIYRAKVFFELEEIEKATLDYSKAIDLTQNNWELFKFRGITYQHSQNYQNAIEDFSQALEIRLEEFQDIENQKIQISNLYFLRGSSYASLKKYDQALIDFENALNFFSNNIEAKNSIKRISKIK